MINTLNNEIFTFNYNSKTSVIEIGNCKNKIVIYEGLFLYPDKVRDYALNTTYFKDPNVHSNPGWQIPAAGIKKVELAGFLLSQYREVFGTFYDSKLNIVDSLTALFHIYNKRGTPQPHIDLAMYGGLCSLNTDEENEAYQNHTYFYRLKETGQEYDVLNQTRQEKVANSKMEDWELYHKQPHKYNTYYFYEAQLHHTGYWNHDLEDHETPRITFNTFSDR